LEYIVDKQQFLLEPGDSLMFSAQLVHTWRNTGSDVVNAIVMISCFDDSERPSEYHLVFPESKDE
jgi:quercetin dioxygenase-like cupin family protein